MLAEGCFYRALILFYCFTVFFAHWRMKTLSFKLTTHREAIFEITQGYNIALNYFNKFENLEQMPRQLMFEVSIIVTKFHWGNFSGCSLNSPMK